MTEFSAKTNIPDDKIKSAKQLAGYATELLDSEVQEVAKIIVNLQRKYQHRANTTQNLEALRDETLTRLAAVGVLATVDPSPVYYGEPPVVEIIGKIKTDQIHTEGFDHEAKRFEVQAAHKRGEYYYGEKEPTNPVSKAAKRERSRKENLRKLQGE